jgi:uncharacterized protein YggE
MMDQRMMAFGAAKEVPVAPGEMPLNASVQVTYELIVKSDKK